MNSFDELKGATLSLACRPCALLWLTKHLIPLLTMNNVWLVACSIFNYYSPSAHEIVKLLDSKVIRSSHGYKFAIGQLSSSSGPPSLAKSPWTCHPLADKTSRLNLWLYLWPTSQCYQDLFASHYLWLTKIKFWNEYFTFASVDSYPLDEALLIFGREF